MYPTESTFSFGAEHAAPGVPGAPQAAPIVPPLTKSTSGKKKKDREKDPDSPRALKRPRTAYILFCMEYRKALDKSIDFNTATTLAADAWKKASWEIRHKYEELASLEKHEYNKKLQAMMEKQPNKMKMANPLLEEHKPEVAGPSHPTVVAPYPYPGATPSYTGPPTSAGYPSVQWNVPNVGPSAWPPIIITAGGAGPGAPEGNYVHLQGAGPAPISDVDTVLNSLDMDRAKMNLDQAGFSEDAYYNLLDVWRKGSNRVDDAVRSYRFHLDPSKPKQDYKAFMVGIFGYEGVKAMLRQR